ncbi:MAG TPA: hypothetical protein VMM79_01540 [Longimicrobiales bacterium]|nr:hypothetical protein [Longimicrobiales bacterium]
MGIFSSKLLTGSVLAVIGLITVKVIMAIVGALSGFVSLLFSLLPILLVGWLILKVIKHLGRDKKAAYD